MERRFPCFNGAILPFFFLIFSLSFFAEDLVGVVSGRNLEMVHGLWHYSENYLGVKENVPSIEDPVIFAQAHVLGAVPEVSWRINSGENTSVLFGWGEAHAKRVEGRLGNPNCPETRVSLAERENGVRPELEAEFFFGGEKRRMRLDSGAAAVPFSKSELEAGFERDGKTGKASENALNVSVSGRIYFEYERVEEGYNYGCVRRCSGKSCQDECGCRFYRKVEPVFFVREVEGGKSFAVEEASLEYFVFGPGLLESTAGRGNLGIAVFSGERLREISVFKDGDILAQREMHGLFEVRDEFGIGHVYSGNDSAFGNGITHEEEWNLPFALVGKNRSFSQAYRIEKETGFGQGENALEARAQNDFSRERAFNFSIVAKEKTATVVVGMGLDGSRGSGDDGNGGGLGGEGTAKAGLFDSEGNEIGMGLLDSRAFGHVALASFQGSGAYLPSAGARDVKGGMLIWGENALAIIALVFVGLGFAVGLGRH